MFLPPAHNYGDLSSQAYLGPIEQKRNYYYDKDFLRQQQPMFSCFYPTPSYYQASFFPAAVYPPTNYNQYQKYGINSTAPVQPNHYDNRYYSQQIWPNMTEKQNRSWNGRDKAFPLSTYSASFAPSYDANPMYQYARQPQSMSYQNFYRPNVGNYSSEGVSYYGRSTNATRTNWSDTNMTSFSNVSSISPAKIRVFLMQPDASCSQQPYTGPPAMPPFLFDRMAQPLCAFPLPPRLPQISSLPLTASLQQRVMQQYANPVAVLPSSLWWQQSQSYMPPYPPAYQQQQSTVPMSAFQSPQYAPQPFASPITLPPNIQTLVIEPLSSMSFSNPASLIPQYPESSFPSTCRACIPPPPPLNMAVRDHWWMQHCSACHHIPADASSPNVRPSHVRMTPLLRQPTVVEYLPNQRTSQKQRFRANEISATDPWSHKFPPLPPGATIISDEYVDKNDSSRDYIIPQGKYQNHNQRGNRTVEQLDNLTISSRAGYNGTLRHHSRGKRTPNAGRDVDSRRSLFTSTSAGSLCSSCTLLTSCSCTSTERHSGNASSCCSCTTSRCCSCTTSRCSTESTSVDESVEYDKIVIDPLGRKRSTDHEQPTTESQNLNSNPNYKLHTLPMIPNAKCYLKSNETSLNVLSIADLSRQIRQLLTEGKNQRDQSSRHRKSSTKGKRKGRSKHSPSSTPSQPTQSNQDHPQHDYEQQNPHPQSQ